MDFQIALHAKKSLIVTQIIYNTWCEIIKKIRPHVIYEAAITNLLGAYIVILEENIYIILFNENFEGKW